MMTELACLACLALFSLLREHQFSRREQEWRHERRALLERLAPGIVFQDDPALKPARPVGYRSPRELARIERERQAAK